MDLKALVRDIPDFPKPGIIFKDITPLLKNPEAFHQILDILEARYKDMKIAKIAAIESRGFLFGAALADRLGIGLIPVRKPGKLPAQTVSQEFDLEYGTDTLEIHMDALEPGDRVLIVDDLLATGGTLDATAKLVQRVGGTVAEIATVIELAFLEGRKRLAAYPYFTVMTF
jgi:adenine phosphoribosyltransferase